MSAHVYRIFDKADRLIYIGCTRDVEARIYQHKWTHRIVDSHLIQGGYHHHDSTKYPDLATARAAERDAIAEQRPWLNRQHNPSRWAKDGREGAYLPLDPEGYKAIAAEWHPWNQYAELT